MSEVETIRSRLAEDGRVTCEALITFLFEYLSGELPPERESAVERHLANCPSCVAYLRSYREAVRLGRSAMRSDERPTELSPELVRALLELRG